MKSYRFMRQRPMLNSRPTGWHLSAMIRKPDGDGSPAREITGATCLGIASKKTGI